MSVFCTHHVFCFRLPYQVNSSNLSADISQNRFLFLFILGSWAGMWIEEQYGLEWTAHFTKRIERWEGEHCRAPPAEAAPLASSLLYTQSPQFSGLLTLVLNNPRGKSKTSGADNRYENAPGFKSQVNKWRKKSKFYAFPNYSVYFIKVEKALFCELFFPEALQEFYHECPYKLSSWNQAPKRN